MSYVPWQPATLSGGHAGVLTGAAEYEDRPVVAAGGKAAPVRRSDITSHVVHAFAGGTGDAYDMSQSSEAVRSGDVLWLPALGSAAVLYEAWPIEIDPAPGAPPGDFQRWNDSGADGLAAADGGLYAAAVADARNLLAQAAARAAGTGPPGFQPGDLVLRRDFGDTWMVTGHNRPAPGKHRVLLAAAAWVPGGASVTGAEAEPGALILIRHRPASAPAPRFMQQAAALAAGAGRVRGPSRRPPAAPGARPARLSWPPGETRPSRPGKSEAIATLVFDTGRAARCQGAAAEVVTRLTQAAELVGVSLLGLRVSARAVLDPAEHERRRRCGLAAVTDPALLGRLLELPAGEPVRDPAAWAETSCQPPGVVVRDDDGHTVTRLLSHPLALTDVTVQGRAGQELRAVQRASLFATFTRRWVALESRGTPERVLLEAMTCGVGLTRQGGSDVVLPAEPPTVAVQDGWAWMLQEQTYRAWLSGR